MMRKYGHLCCFAVVALAGCGEHREPPRSEAAPSPASAAVDQTSTNGSGEAVNLPAGMVIERREQVEDFSQPIAVFQTVFWEPLDTTSLRALIRNTQLVRGKDVLEIGTGTGLVSLCCLQHGARSVVATDINPNAVACALYNARRLGLAERFEVRQVTADDPAAFAVIDDGRRFDLIISNPPWENVRPHRIDDYALFDKDFALMRSLLAGLADHLKPHGQALLAYGCVTAIQTLQKLAAEYKLTVEILDDRDPLSLQEVFLPGMLLRITPGASPPVP